MTTTQTPAHLAPTACYVCGRPEHSDSTPTGHRYWSNTDARREFASGPQSVLPERPEGYYHQPLTD